MNDPTADIGEIFRQAIAERRRVEVEYMSGCYIIEPYAYGITSRGKKVIRAFRIDRNSEYAPSEEWTLLRVDRIQSIYLLDERFVEKRPDYRRGDLGMPEGIIAEV